MRFKRYLFVILLAFCSPLWAASEAKAPSCSPFSHDKVLTDSDLRLCWHIQNGILHMQAIHPGNTWFSLGFGYSMTGSDAVVARPDTAEVKDVYITGRQLDDVKLDAEQNLKNARVRYSEGYTVAYFERALVTGDSRDTVIDADDFTAIIWAVGDGRNFGLHTEFGLQQLNFASGAFKSRQLPLVMLLHAVLMVVCWLLLSPIVILITRYCKVTTWQDFPNELDNKFWWRIHWVGKTAIVCLSFAALILAVIGVGGIDMSPLHAKLGVVVLLLSLNQILLGVFRGSKGGPVDGKGRVLVGDEQRGDHYDMTLHRHVFEFFHKSLGYLTLFTAQLAIYTGLFLFELNGYFYLAVFIVQLVFGGLMFWFMKKGRYINSYQAIWGYDKQHPGNQ